MTITTNEIDNTLIGVYNNAKTTKRSGIIKLIEFLDIVQNHYKDKVLNLRKIEDVQGQKTYKMNNLMGVTISSLLGDNRTANNIVQYNNLMCVDVDEEDNQTLFAKYDIEYIKQQIFELNFVYCVCLSCRGKGFYFIVPIPDAHDIDVYYTSMYYILKRYDINIDKHCKDITRIRFQSYDENILIKRDCEIDVFDMISEEQINKKKAELANARKRKNTIKRHSHNEEMKRLEHAIDFLIHKGFDTGEHWSEWATVGKYLKTLGDDGRMMFHRLSEVSSGYKGYDDVEKNWKRFHQCASEDEAFGKFYTMIRNKYGINWRKEMEKQSIMNLK